MGKFKRNFKKYICLSLSMALIITTVFVGTTASADNIEYYRSAKVWKGGENGDTISVSDYALLKGDGSAADAAETEFDSTYINGLMANLQQGEVTAKKTVLFANDADKAKGYLKTNLDIVGNVTQTGNPKDVLFVSTVSNTAAMFGAAKDVHVSCPCMNTDHYYRIPAGFESNTTQGGSSYVKNETGADLYFNIFDVCGSESFSNFSSITPKTINDYLKKTYGKTLNLYASGNELDKSGNGTRDFWNALLKVNQGDDPPTDYRNHYVPTEEAATEDNGIKQGALIWYKSDDGSYKPKITNMRPVASAMYKEWLNTKNSKVKYASPAFDNADGCFDRMMTSKKLIKSFAVDLLATNTSNSDTNNRVALINYAGYDMNGSALGFGYWNKTDIINNIFSNANTNFPVVQFADFTDGTNDSTDEFDAAVNNLRAFSGIDYAAAMYAASQVMIDSDKVRDIGSDYKSTTTTEATLEATDLENGYIWVGDSNQRVVSDSNNSLIKSALIYSTENNKYWTTPNLTKVKGTRKNADKIVIFITDAPPGNANGISAVNTKTDNKGYDILHSMAYYNYNYDTALAKLKEDGAQIYTAAYMINKGTYTVGHQFEGDNIVGVRQFDTVECLQYMASGETGEKDKYFKDALNLDDFTIFLNNIKGDLLKTTCKSVSDTLGNHYSFVCDADHPVSIINGDGNTFEYSSLNAAVQSGYFKLSEDKKTIIWNGGDVSKGVRISFYSKLDDEYLFPKSPSAAAVDYETNSKQTVVYTNDADETGTEITRDVEYAGYKLRVKSASVKVVLSRTPAGDIRKDKDITYTLSLEKAGAFDLNGVTVTAGVPNYTTLNSSSLPSGEITKDTPLSYTVTANGEGITENETVIENFAHFTISKADNHIQNDVDLSIEKINTNTVKNAISTKGTITITAPNKKLTHDKTQAYIYKVTNSDGTEIARVMVAAGKQEVISGLGVGNYTITEITDWAWRYKDGNTNELNVSISNDNPDGHAEFSKENQKAGSLSGHSSKRSNKYGANGGVSTNG